MTLNWERTNDAVQGVSTLNANMASTVSLCAEEWPFRRGLWCATVDVGGKQLRAGHRIDTELHSREEAERAAVELLLKYLQEAATVIGYKVVECDTCSGSNK